MDSLKDSLAFWSSILGAVLGILGVRLDSGWIALLGFLLITMSSAVFLYAWSERRRLKLADITIEGRRIDSLNVANVARRLNRTLVVQEVDQVATIRGEDLIVAWRYSGYCRAPHESVVELSIDMDTHIPFERLDCYAYDLHHDPQRNHEIRPVLLGSDGLSKKIGIPLLQPLAPSEPFSVLVRCRMPGSMKSGLDYYTSTVSVSQARVTSFATRILFIGKHPEWLRVYQCDSSGAVTLLKDIRPTHVDTRTAEYIDLATDVPANAARIYLFHRSFQRSNSKRHPATKSGPAQAA